MKKILVLAAILALAGSGVCLAEQMAYWRAASSSAKAVTGDIGISPTKLVIDFYPFLMVQARTLKPEEVAAVFDADVNSSIAGALYRVNVPAHQQFLHHNTLCGSDQTEWMAAYFTGRSLQVAFFSGDDPPVFTFDAISHSTTLCGTYIYGR